MSYVYRMGKQAISVTLQPDNLLWLRAQARVLGLRSLSEMLDQVVTRARQGDRQAHAPSRSVAGTVHIAEDDPDLGSADSALRVLFVSSAASRPRKGRAGLAADKQSGG